MKISPSILDANFQTLQSEIDSIVSADRIHLDVMDGQYVPGITFGASILKKIQFPVETEVHLMVDDPEQQFDAFESLGVNMITFHIENTQDVIKLLQDIKSRNIKAGICVDGYTSTDILSDEVLDIVDQVLLMSVKAGKGGQSFMPGVFDKIKCLRKRGYTGEIEVDGGVNLDNAGDLKSAGADIVVVGNFIMKKEISKRSSVIKDFQKI